MFRQALLSEMYAKKYVMLKVTAGILLFVTMTGSLMHTLEPEVFESIFDGIWWSIVTISTVGYGDFVPVSFSGRLIAILLILTGIAVFSFFITNLAAATVTIKEQREKGMGDAASDSHVIIIGWNERSRLLISQLRHNQPKKPVVLVDQTLQKLPADYHFLRYIQGDPKLDETLARANIQQAETVVITANLHVDEKLADANTILTLIAVRALSTSVHTIAELITTEHVKNAKRAGADEIIETSRHVGMLLMNGTLFHGMTDVIMKMLAHGQKDHLVIKPLPAYLQGKTFRDALATENSTSQFVMGLKRADDALLHPDDTFILRESDELIYVKR